MRRRRSRAARAGRPRRGSPRGLRGPGASREAGAAEAASRPPRPAREAGDRTRPGTVSRALPAQPAGARRRGDGPPGRTAGPSLRGDRLPDRRDRRGAGTRRSARPGIGWTKSDTTRRPRRAAACSTGSGSTAAANGRHPYPGRPDDGGKDSASMVVLRAVGIGGVGGRLCVAACGAAEILLDAFPVGAGVSSSPPVARWSPRPRRHRYPRNQPRGSGSRRGQQQGESLHRSSSSHEFRGCETQDRKGERRGPFHSPMPALHINTHPS